MLHHLRRRRAKEQITMHNAPNKIQNFVVASQKISGLTTTMTTKANSAVASTVTNRVGSNPPKMFQISRSRRGRSKPHCQKKKEKMRRGGMHPLSACANANARIKEPLFLPSNFCAQERCAADTEAKKACTGWKFSKKFEIIAMTW